MDAKARMGEKEESAEHQILNELQQGRD